MIRHAITAIAAALAIAGPVQASTSGDAVLDVGMAACDRHRAGEGYAAGYSECHRLAQAWADAALETTMRQEDADNYAGAEPEAKRDLYRIWRALGLVH